VRELNGNLRDEIASKLKRTEVKESRFVTFLPQDRQKHFDSKSSLQEYQELQDKYRKLQGLAREQNVRLTAEEGQQLEELRRENRALIEQADEMLRARTGGNNEVLALQRKLEENEREK
jgi:replicative DNA helicase